jgi:hypothetical protein
MHAIARQMPGVDAAFTPFYATGVLALFKEWGFLENTVLGDKLGRRCLEYLERQGLTIDVGGRRGPYDLVVTCSDLVIPGNLGDARIVLVQEGMTDPEDVFYHLYRRMPFLPRWIGSTSTTGLSLRYERFCVASPGYRDLFIGKGVPGDRIVVTGIPNFDNCAEFAINTFPHKGYVLVCTSDMRETYKREDRKGFIRRAVRIAAGRPMIFKLHPNENHDRATREIHRYAPGALVFVSGNAEEMIANAEVLITRLSSTVLVGLSLGKECYSDFPMDQLRALIPLQHGRAAANIARVCLGLLEERADPSGPPGRGNRVSRTVRSHRRESARHEWGGRS